MTIARATKVARILLAIASVALWLLLLRPQALGGPAAYLVIRGDSMLPTYESGDLLILHAADRFGVGDVVAYRVPEGEFGEGHLRFSYATGMENIEEALKRIRSLLAR